MGLFGRRSGLTFMLLALLLTQVGCWEGREINARTFVTAIAFDLTKDEEKQTEQYLISIQMSVPEKMAGNNGQGGGEGKPFIVLGSTAGTVTTGILQLQRQLDRKIFLGHTRLILISEKVATTFGLEQIIDYFKRDFTIQRMARIAVVQGEAREILELEPPMGQTPSTYVLNMISPQSGSSFTYISDLGKLLVLQADEGIDPVLPRVRKRQKTELTGGAAVLKNGRFYGWLDDFETRGLNILQNELVESDYVVDCPVHYGQKIVVGINSLRSVYRLEKAGGSPVLKIKVDGRFETREFTGQHGPAEELKDGLERNVMTIIKEELEKTIDRAQELGTDILGVGRYLQAYHPKIWAQLNWEEEFPSFPFELEVKMEWGLTVRRVGG